MPIALRLSSHLLLGVVRIYSRKVNYLFDDCSEALLKVKQAFRSATVDLLPEESTAPYHSIILPETFDLDDFELPDSEIFQGNYVDRHISSKDQITLQDTMEVVVYSTSKFGLDERFDDDDASGFDLDEELMVEKAVTAEHATGTSNSNVEPHTSVQDHASFKYDDNQDDLNVPVATPAIGNENQHLEEYNGENEPIDYAQAPCTPGLWEEPNLSNIQETSAFEDHIEPENHAITESAVKENLENSSHEQPYNLFDSHEKSPSHVATTEQVLTNNLGSTPLTEFIVAEQHHNQFESHEKFLPHLTSEQTLMNPFSTPFKEYLVVDHKESEPIIAVSDDPAKLQDLLNKNVRDKAPAVQTVDYTHDSIASSGFSSLRPCVTLLNHETNRERPHATEAFDMNFPQIHLLELGPNNEVQVTCNISTSDFPAPEKLLSLPQGIPDVPRYMVSESTPTPQHIPTAYEGDVGTNTISGKKRSFTESSLTAQSLDLNQSSGFFIITTNATEKSIVNDDDLLSSILGMLCEVSSILRYPCFPLYGRYYGDCWDAA